MSVPRPTGTPLKTLPLEAFQAPSAQGYALLPFRFAPIPTGEYLLTNIVGEYILLHRTDLTALITHKLPMHSPIYDLLKSKHFLLDGASSVALDLLAAKYRTKLASLSSFTGLHIVVPTLRCNSSCVYCQVSSQSPERTKYDMTEQIADRVVEFIFRSPSQSLKVEFQGGEPLLNFPILQRIVERTSQLNSARKRDIEFVVCTNLTLLTQEMITYIREHNLLVSTSLDGPADLHNHNRPGRSKPTHDTVVRNIRMLQEAIGLSRVSALMTTTRASLDQPERIIDEYVRLGFRSIFLRILNPYGRAASPDAYSVEEWLRFYSRALDHILHLNYNGLSFREEYTAIILRKMLTPYGTGFVDLQSPAALGIGVLVYDYDGNVYPSDESRMLAAMGDSAFLLGNLLHDSYQQIVCSDKLVALVRDTMLEGVPQCADCPLLAFCGADPVRHYRLQGDLIGHKPTSEFCKKNMEIMYGLIHLIEHDAGASPVLYSWL